MLVVSVLNICSVSLLPSQSLNISGISLNSAVDLHLSARPSWWSHPVSVVEPTVYTCAPQITAVAQTALNLPPQHCHLLLQIEYEFLLFFCSNLWLPTVFFVSVNDNSSLPVLAQLKILESLTFLSLISIPVCQPGLFYLPQSPRACLLLSSYASSNWSL